MLLLHFGVVAVQMMMTVVAVLANVDVALRHASLSGLHLFYDIE